MPGCCVMYSCLKILPTLIDSVCGGNQSQYHKVYRVENLGQR